MAQPGIESAPSPNEAEQSPKLQNPSCVDVWKPGQPKPDFKAIHSAKQNLDLVLNSAYIESAEQSPKGQTLARQDFKAAVRAADKSDPNWIEAQTKALTVDRNTNLCTYAKLSDQFRAGVDRLDPTTRREVNALTYKIQYNFANEGPSVWTSHQPEVARLMKLLPKNLQGIYKQFPFLDRQNDQISQGFGDLADLQSAPLKTRLLGARFEALVGNDDGSRKLLEEIGKINPDLKDSDLYKQAMETPHILAETIWSGENGTPAPPTRSSEDKLLDALKGLLGDLPPGDTPEERDPLKNSL